MTREDCAHAVRGVCQPAFRLTYECACGESWTGEWSCAVDDECPACGCDVVPSDAVEVASCACDYLKERNCN